MGSCSEVPVKVGPGDVAWVGGAQLPPVSAQLSSLDMGRCAAPSHSSDAAQHSQSRRLTRLTSHLATPSAEQSQAGAPACTAAHTASSSGPAVPIAVPHSGGHVHPSVCVTANGTLVIVYATDLDDSRGKDALLSVTSADGGVSWSAPAVIEATRQRPSTVRDTGSFEVYPGTLTTLPDDRVLVTWQYIASGDTEYRGGGALCFALSETQGRSWGGMQTIVDPANPPDVSINEPRHLGAMRHGMLAMEDGRWLLPLRDPKPEPGSPWGPRLYDPKTKAMEDFLSLWPGGRGAHPAVRGTCPLKQVRVLLPVICTVN